MKKIFAFLALVFAALVIFAMPVLAATGDIAIDDLKVDAIVALTSGSIAMAAIQWIKKKLNWTGVLAYVLTIAIDAVFTAGYFGYQLIFNHQAWNWLAVGIYIAAVFLWQKYGFRLSKWLGKTQAEIKASTPSS